MILYLSGKFALFGGWIYDCIMIFNSAFLKYIDGVVE